MPTPVTLQRSYLSRGDAVEDQAASISRRLVNRGGPAAEQGGPTPLQPVSISDDKPTDTVSSDIYTGGAATKLRTTGGDYNFGDSISRRLNTTAEMGSQATAFAQEKAYQTQAQKYQDMYNSAGVGYNTTFGEGGAGATGTRADIIKAAEKYLGTKYTWGGEDPKNGFDCSGLIQYVYGQYNIKTPRVSQDQARMGRVTRNLGELKPGDFVAWDRGGTGGASHIAIYAGNGRVIESPRSGLNVRYRSINMNEPGIYGVAINI